MPLPIVTKFHRIIYMLTILVGSAFCTSINKTDRMMDGDKCWCWCAWLQPTGCHFELLISLIFTPKGWNCTLHCKGFKKPQFIINIKYVTMKFLLSSVIICTGRSDLMLSMSDVIHLITFNKQIPDVFICSALWHTSAMCFCEHIYIYIHTQCFNCPPEHIFLVCRVWVNSVTVIWND